MASVFLIEDDPVIRSALVRSLAERGFVVEAVTRGLAGLERILSQAPDVVVLDLGLPDVDGIELLRMVRAVNQVPVIVATARDDEAEIIRAFDAGADDYVVKPFSTEQLEARLRAVLRRGRSERCGAIVVGALRIDPETRVVTLGEEILDLSRKEFDLLLCLATSEGRVVSKRQIQAEVWRQPYGGADKTVDVHLSWLRRKLGETPAEPRYLHTVRGVGVKLVAPPP